jgi:hypothetical protein
MASLYPANQQPQEVNTARSKLERNGFIHAMLIGTPLENHGYEYFGERAYSQWIQGD